MDAEALATVANELRPSLTRRAMRMRRNLQDAEDAVSETIRAAIINSEAIVPEGASAYLFKALATKCVDAARKDKRERFEQLHRPDDLESPTSESPIVRTRIDIGMRLLAAGYSIPEGCRVVGMSVAGFRRAVKGGVQN